MMDLMFCEKCGCFFIPSSEDPEVGDYILGKVQSVDSHINVESVGLCPKCYSAFVDWMKVKPDGDEVEDD